MWIPLVFAALFLAAALANTFGSDRNLVEATAGYAIALCLFEIWRLFRRNARHMEEFAHWLVENRDAIETGTADYNGTPIGLQTELTQYQMVMSLVVVTINAASRFYIVGAESTLRPALFFTVSSLALGWWGLPFGPLYTIAALGTNLRGGKRCLVGELLYGAPAAAWDGSLEREVVYLTERAAENTRRILAERGFPPGTALQVEVTGDPGFQQYSVTYDDLPPTDGSAWRHDAYGITVIVRKSDERRLAGLVVDFGDNEYTFKESVPKTELHDL